MVRDPWPMRFSTRPPNILFKDLVHFCCPYSVRYTLICGTSRRECKYCYMRQQGMTEEAILRAIQNHEIYEPVVHICDRCHSEIPDADTPYYIELSNRQGGSQILMELCHDCAKELADWLVGYDYPLPYKPDTDYQYNYHPAAKK